MRQAADAVVDALDLGGALGANARAARDAYAKRFPFRMKRARRCLHNAPCVTRRATSSDEGGACAEHKALKKAKPPAVKQGASINPAASYSPTALPLQYHWL